jgi:DNA-binding IclR family transcriptional regulator
MTAKYTNSSQQRILRLVLAMFGDVVNGYMPGQLCQLTNSRPDAMTRDLENLVTAGLAERDEDGRYRLTARLPQQAVKVHAAIGRTEARLAETRSAIHRNNDY